MVESPVILFDGVCNLCSSSVQWIIRRDRRAKFRFASLQSRAGQATLAASNPPPTLPDSIILIADGRILTKSDAVISIASGLGLPWSLVRIARIIPRPLRDALYSGIARNRYRWFGKLDACMVPTPDLRARFLDADEPRTP